MAVAGRRRRPHSGSGYAVSLASSPRKGRLQSDHGRYVAVKVCGCEGPGGAVTEAARGHSVGCKEVQAVARADSDQVAVGVMRVVQDLFIEIPAGHAVLAREPQFAL